MGNGLETQSETQREQENSASDLALKKIEEEEQAAQQNFLQKIKNRKKTNATFFTVNGGRVKGANNELLDIEIIPLFAGAYLDLKKASIVGQKKIFQSPKAEGVGGELILQPRGIRKFEAFPISHIEMQQNKVSAEASLGQVRGFKGNNISLTADSLRLTTEQIEMVSPQWVYADGTKREIGKNIHIKEFETDYDDLEKTLYPVQAQPASISTPADGPTSKPMADLTSQPATISAPADAPAQTASPALTQETPPSLIRSEEKKVQKRIITKFAKKPIDLCKYDSLEITEQGDLINMTLTIGDTSFSLMGKKRAEDGVISSVDSISIPKSTDLVNALIGTAKVENFSIEEFALVLDGFLIYPDGTIESSLKAPETVMKLCEQYMVGYQEGRLTAGVEGEDFVASLFKVGEALGLREKSAETEDEEDDPTLLMHLINQVMGYLGFEEDEEKEASEEEKEGKEDAEDDKTNLDWEFPLLVWPIVPGLLSASLDFHARSTLGYSVRGSAGKFQNGLERAEKEGQKGQTVGFNLSGGLMGHALFGIGAGIDVGLYGILNTSARLEGNIKLGGIGESEEILGANTEVLFQLGERNMPHFKEAVFTAKGGLDLKAVIEGAVKAKILVWKKNIFSYTFKEWDLGQIEGMVEAKKAAGERWQVTPTLSFSVLGGKIQGTVTTKDNLASLFEEAPEVQTQGKFDASSDAFTNAIKFLQDFHDKSQLRVVDTNPATSGFQDMNQQIADIQWSFYMQYKNEEELIEEQRQELVALLNDKKLEKNQKLVEGEIEKISQRMEHINQAVKRLNPEDSYGAVGSTTMGSTTKGENVLKAYHTAGGDKKGFEGHLQDKAKAQAVTVERLIAYEKKRIEELSEDIDKKILAFHQFVRNKGIAEDDKEKGSILVPQYEKTFGDIKGRVQYADAAVLQQKEEARLEEKKAKRLSFGAIKYRKHSKRLEDLKQKFSPDILQDTVVHPEVTEAYQQDAKGFFSDLRPRANKELLLQYCEKILMENPEFKKAEAELKSFQDDRTQLQQLRGQSSILPEDETRKERLTEGIQERMNVMKKDKKYLYMTATKEDFARAYQSEMVKEAGTRIPKPFGRQKWLEQMYDAVKDKQIIDDIIEYEKKRIEAYSGKPIEQKEHSDRFLALQVAADTHDAPTIDQAVKNYFFGSTIKGSFKREGYLSDLRERIDQGDLSTLPLLGEMAPEMEEEYQSILQSEGSMRDIIHQYGKRDGKGNIDAKANRKMLEEYREETHKESQEEDLETYYTYQMKRDARNKKGIDSYTMFLELQAQKDTLDYPELLKQFEKTGLGKRYQTYLKETAKQWVTPIMIWDYEMSKVTGFTQKHTDRIEALRHGDKDGVMLSERLQKKVEAGEMKISPQELYQLAESEKSALLEKHHKRLLALEGPMVDEGGQEITDPEQIAAEKEKRIQQYDGTNYEPKKEEVQAEYERIRQSLIESPEKMAAELKEYEGGQKENLETILSQSRQKENTLVENIKTSADRAEACLTIYKNVEEAIKNPEAILSQAASTTDYVKNILEETKKMIAERGTE